MKKYKRYSSRQVSGILYGLVCDDIWYLEKNKIDIEEFEKYYEYNKGDRPYFPKLHRDLVNRIWALIYVLNHE